MKIFGHEILWMTRGAIGVSLDLRIFRRLHCKTEIFRLTNLLSISFVLPSGPVAIKYLNYQFETWAEMRSVNGFPVGNINMENVSRLGAIRFDICNILSMDP